MTYSDNGMEEVLARLFGDHVGHACDVGANDGKFNSNTLALEEVGWTVLCVEPNPVLSERGRAKRRLWREVACGHLDIDGVPFHAINDIGDRYASHSALSFNGKGPADWMAKTVFSVSVRRLDRILEEAGFHRLDLLTVDVEGWEREVMAGFTLERWKPKVIVLEQWQIENSLVIPGYFVVDRRMYDNVYLREE